jgi:hypothetical protein
MVHGLRGRRTPKLTYAPCNGGTPFNRQPDAHPVVASFRPLNATDCRPRSRSTLLAIASRTFVIMVTESRSTVVQTAS